MYCNHWAPIVGFCSGSLWLLAEFSCWWWSYFTYVHAGLAGFRGDSVIQGLALCVVLWWVKGLTLASKTAICCSATALPGVLCCNGLMNCHWWCVVLWWSNGLSQSSNTAICCCTTATAVIVWLALVTSSTTWSLFLNNFCQWQLRLHTDTLVLLWEWPGMNTDMEG